MTLITYVNGDIEDIHNIYIGDEFLENLPIYKVNECNILVLEIDKIVIKDDYEYNHNHSYDDSQTQNTTIPF